MSSVSQIWIPKPEAAAACHSCEQLAYGSAATVGQWRKLLASPTTVALAHGSKPSAVAVARCDASGWELLLVAVAPNARRRGFGRQLVELLGETQQLQLRLPETATESLQFATAVGFKVERIGHCEHSSGCDCIYLIRDPK